MAEEQGYPVDLQTGVQRMIDAGESEANIAAAIQAYKAQADPASARTAADARAKAVQDKLEKGSGWGWASQLTGENIAHDLGQWGTGALSAGKAILKQVITNPLGIAQPEIKASDRPWPTAADAATSLKADMGRLRTLPSRALAAIKDPIEALAEAGVTPDLAAQLAGNVSTGAGAVVATHGATKLTPTAIGNAAVTTGEGLTALGESPLYGKLSRAGGAYVGNKVVHGAGGLIGGAVIGDAIPAATSGMGRLITRGGRALLPDMSAERYLANQSGYVPGEVLDPGAGDIQGAGVDPHLANKSGYVPGSASENTTQGPSNADLWERYLANVSGYEAGAPVESGGGGRIPITGEPLATDPNRAPEGVNRYAPNVSGYEAAGEPAATSRIPYAAQTTTAAPEPAPNLVKGEAPSLDDALQAALDEILGDKGGAGTTPPAVTQTPTGRPSVTPERGAEIAANVQTGSVANPETGAVGDSPALPGVLRTRENPVARAYSSTTAEPASTGAPKRTAAAPRSRQEMLRNVTDVNPHGDVEPEVMDMIRQIASENDELRFNKRNFNPAGPGRGGDLEVSGGSGGATSYQDVLNEGGYGSRADIVRAANDVIDGTGRSNGNTKAVIEAARARLRGENIPAELGKSLPPDAHSMYETPREVAQRERSGFLPRGTQAPSTSPLSEQLIESLRQRAQEQGIPFDESAAREYFSDPDLLAQQFAEGGGAGGGDTDFNPAELEGGEPGERGMVETPSTADKEPKGQLRDELGARDAQRLLNRTLGQQGTTESLRGETPARATGQTSETSIWPRPRIKAVSDTVREMLANGATDDELRAYINKSPNDMGKRMTTMIINTLAPDRAIPVIVGAAAGGAALRKALVGQLQQNQQEQ